MKQTLVRHIDGWLITLVLAVAIALALLALAEAAAIAAPARLSWVEHVRAADEAIAAGDITTAVRAVSSAYGAALQSGGWEGLLAVGDATLRVGAASKSSRAAEPQARQTYLTAMFRARQAGSLDGVLRACRAFDRLGDGSVVLQCVKIARQIARRPDEVARVAAFNRGRDDAALARVEGRPR
ncbi:MAG: hypothetical protein HY294_10605 [Candidatus Rokubacteria bacterium]|nr:hypothetical protein [Candidatus Rokubacteria bacterium]MBI3826434.1 hypothetical protein [Candidatus Rokubacteria bacterium]